MRKRQLTFEAKGEEYLRRGLRVKPDLDEKVLFAKHGRSKIWNAGRSKSKGAKRRTGKIGGYEFAKNIGMHDTP